MMTRTIIKKILPRALPNELLLATVLISTILSGQAWAAEEKAVGAKEESMAGASGAKPVEATEDKAALPAEEKPADGTDIDAQGKPDEGKNGDEKKSSVKKGDSKKKVDVKKKSTSSPSLPASSESSAARIKELTYDASTVYVIRTKYGYQTNIVFDPKEEIQAMSVGDRSLWQLIPAGNRLYIRPMTENLSTNMTLLTNKHSYEFDLKSVDDKSESNAYVIRFVYPEKITPPPSMPADNSGFTMIPPQPQVNNSPEFVPNQPIIDGALHSLRLPNDHMPVPNDHMPKPAPAVVAPESYNYNYTYSGVDALAPLQVYDDGHSTYIKYAAIPKSIPSALVVDANGKESPAPSIVKGSSLIIDGVVGELALRSENGEVVIYNESINPR